METLINQTNNKVDSITKESLGLGNVDNTHDEDKNVNSSKHFTVQGLESGTDLNNVIHAGAYRVSGNALAASLKNCPTTNSFCMIVLKGAGTYQEITEYMPNNPRKWFRNIYEYGNDIGPWYRIYTEADPQTNLS